MQGKSDKSDKKKEKSQETEVSIPGLKNIGKNHPLKDVPPGKIGTLKIMKSGRHIMDINGFKFDMIPGVPCDISQVRLAFFEVIPFFTFTLQGRREGRGR